MSIQMTLIFALLTVECGLVSILLLPLPPRVQSMVLRKYDETISNSNFAIVLSFTDVLVGVMFVDAFKNGFKLLERGDEIIEFSKNVWDARSKKFYSQRNLYILGAILALQACVWFMSMLLKSTVKNKALLGSLSNEGRTPSSSSDADLSRKTPETETLEKELAKVQLDVETLNKQYDSLFAEYQKKTATPTESDSVRKEK